jgi:hypothetical protein
MVGSRLLRPAFAKVHLLRYLLLVAQLVIVITSFAVVAECHATALASPDRCLSHMNSNGAHEHTHPQPAAILPLNVGQVAFPFTRIHPLTYLPPASILLKIIKPPPQLA